MDAGDVVVLAVVMGHNARDILPEGLGGSARRPEKTPGAGHPISLLVHLHKRLIRGFSAARTEFAEINCIAPRTQRCPGWKPAILDFVQNLSKRSEAG